MKCSHEEAKAYLHTRIPRSKVRKSQEHYLQEIAPQTVQFPLHKDNSSGYRGVSYDKAKRKWVASISYNSRQRHLGYFYKAIQAAKAYDDAVRLYGKSPRLLNFPE